MTWRWLAVTLAVSSCSPITPSFVESDVPAGLTPKPVTTMKLYFDPDLPRCQYSTTGLYHYATQNWRSTPTHSVLEMKKDAAARGFDGLYAIQCAAPGTEGAQLGSCDAKGFVCRSEPNAQIAPAAATH